MCVCNFSLHLTHTLCVLNEEKKIHFINRLSYAVGLLASAFIRQPYTRCKKKNNPTFCWLQHQSINKSVLFAPKHGQTSSDFNNYIGRNKAYEILHVA